MKLIIIREKLKEGLSAIEKISSRSLTLPILNNVLLSCEKNFLNLVATDLEIGIKWWALAKIEKEGKIAVPSKLFINFINLITSEKIDLELKNNNLFLESQNYKTQIRGFLADEFPLIPKISEKEHIFIDSSLFCQAIGSVVDIAVPTTSRPEISGVWLLFQKNLITMAATDSFRLGEKKLFIKENSPLKNDYGLIIPQKTIREIINIFGEKQGQIKIYFSQNQVMFEFPMQETSHPQVQLTSKLIEGDYPNYQEIIPKSYLTQITAPKEDFVNQIKGASLFAGKINEVKIKADPAKERLEITSRSSDIGEYQSFLPAQIKGEPIEVSFNHRFLLDGFLNIKSAEIIFELNSDSGPALIKPVGDSTYLYVVMPIKSD